MAAPVVELPGGLTNQNLRVTTEDGDYVVRRFRGDAELLGMPTIVTVGRGLAEGTIELRDRATGEREEVPVAEAGARVRAAVRGQ